MAIKKEIIFANGLCVNYHNISNVEIDNKNKKINVNVKSYTNNDYRILEKNNNLNKKKYYDLINLIFLENQKEETERNKEQIEKISLEANELVANFKDNLDLSVLNKTYEFEIFDELSISKIYEILKKEPSFIGSEDI